MNLNELIETLSQSMLAADAHQREIEREYGSQDRGITPNPAELWQYLDGLRVAFNTACELAIGVRQAEEDAVAS